MRRLTSYMADALKHRKVFYRVKNDLKIPNSSREKLNIAKAYAKTSDNGWKAIDSLVLTDEEVSYVRNEIEQLKTVKWGPNLLPNFKVVWADSVAVIQKEYAKLLAANDPQLVLRTKTKSVSWQSFFESYISAWRYVLPFLFKRVLRFYPRLGGGRRKFFCL
jgi:hypothetical protein